MAPSSTQLSNALVKLYGSAPFWSLSCYGSTFFGNGVSRPVCVRNEGVSYASLDYPVYGLGYGYNFSPSITAEITTNIVTTDGDEVMTGSVWIREGWYRETTDEYGWAGAATDEIDLGSTPSKIEVTSNSFAYYDWGVTHRIFYVKHENTGVYYEAARVEYTGATDTLGVGDTATINVTAARIILNAELPRRQETKIFPAVKSACFWKGRIWGAGLQPRDFADGTELTFTEGSNIVQIQETSPGSGTFPDTFSPADTYKGIVDRDTNQVVAYIQRVIHNTAAEIRVPGDLEEVSNWPFATVTYDNVGLAGDLAKIYASPIYAGGAGGAIRHGILSFGPLDVLEDEGFYASGAQICRITTAGDDLCVIYDRGIGFFTGAMSVSSPPTCRHFVLARNVGSLNPDSVWQRPDGSVWFVGNGRLYTIVNGEVVDASKRMGVSGLWSKWVENYGDGQRLFQADYNSSRDMALLVNVPKKGEGTGEYGTFAIAIAHDSNTVHGLRWPMKVASVHCSQHDDGQFQFYGGGKDGYLYKLLKTGKKSDDYYDSEGALVSAQPVPWYETFGVKWENGRVWPVGVRFLIESEETSGINITVQADLKTRNIISAEFVADVSRTLSHDRIAREEQLPIHKKGGYAVQYKVSGTTAADFTLIGMSVKEEFLPAKGND